MARGRLKKALPLLAMCFCLIGCKYNYESDNHKDTVPEDFRRPISDEELKKAHEPGGIVTILDDFYFSLIQEKKAKFIDYIDEIKYESFECQGDEFYYIKLQDKSDSYLKSTINTL